MINTDIKDLEKIIAVMNELGFRLTSTESGTMDSGLAVFAKDSTRATILKDRSQWILEGEAEELKAHGLWRAFDEADDFCEALQSYYSS